MSSANDQLPHLEPCFLHGQIKFDNNFTEKAIRPTKLGHKNWMFIVGEDTGWRSAVVYTFVEQVRRHGADPFAYFAWGLRETDAQPLAGKTRSPAASQLDQNPPCGLSDHREPGCIDAIAARALAKMREVLF